MLVYVILRQCCGSYGHAIGSITSNRPRITRFSLQNRFINNVVLFSSYNHPFSLSKSVSGAFSNGLRLSSICLPIRRDITPFSGLFSTKCIDIEDTVNSSQVSSDDVNQSVVDTNIDVLDDIDEETAIEDEDDDMVEDNDDIITELEALNRKDTAISAESKKKSKKSPNMPFELDMKDVVETVAKGGGPGGQHINKCSNRVRLQHVPTGIIVACQDFRDLTSNRKHAYTMLREKVEFTLKGSQSKIGRKIDKIRKQKAKRNRRSKAKVSDKANEAIDSKIEKQETEDQLVYDKEEEEDDSLEAGKHPFK